MVACSRMASPVLARIEVVSIEKDQPFDVMAQPRLRTDDGLAVKIPGRKQQTRDRRQQQMPQAVWHCGLC